MLPSRTHNARPPTLPGLPLLRLADLLVRSGIEDEALFEGLGVRRAPLAVAGAAVPYEVAMQVVQRAIGLSDDALGLRLGASFATAALGPVGVCAVTAPTVLEGLAVLQRYLPVALQAFTIELHVEAGKAAVVLVEHEDLSVARPLVLVAAVASLWQSLRTLTGLPLAAEADFALPAPAALAGFGALGLRPHFERPCTQLVFDEALLALPQRSEEPLAHRDAVALCERQLLEQGLGIDLYDRVQRLVLLPTRGARTLGEMAGLLCTSTRTLKRRLAEHGVTYSEIVERQQRHRALMLLQATETPIKAISARLGYSSVSNFSRAFYRWLGCRPLSYRLATGVAVAFTSGAFPPAPPL